jgi:putative transposase
VIDLYSRRVVGWSMQSRQATDVVLQALHMAVWRRKPKQRVLIHSDQGSQFTSMDWAAFIRAHNLEHSMSRRGNCHDNAVAESFFSSLKRERIRRRTYKTREEARQDVFDYVEMFYNPVRKQVRNGMLSPVEFERQQILKAEGVQKSRGYSHVRWQHAVVFLLPVEVGRLADPGPAADVRNGNAVRALLQDGRLLRV